MKTALPVGLLLLVGAAAALHRASPPPAAGLERRGQIVACPAEVPSATVAAEPPPVVPAEIAPEILRPTPAGSDRKAAPSTLVRMTAFLDRELSLTAHQRETVEQFLKDREAEIKACHAAIVRTGVIDIPHYEWQVRQMKEGWFLKVDALLDRVQQERFVILVQQGFFNEGLAFTVQPGMTVLE